MSEIKLTDKKARSLVHAILGSTGTFVITNIALKAKFGSEGAEILGFIANKDNSFKKSENKEYFIKKLTPNAQDAIKRGFIYTTQYQIEDDLEIPIRTQTRLFKILKDDGVLLVEQHDVPRKNFFKINNERLLDIIEQYDDEREERLRQRKIKRGKDLQDKKKRQLDREAGLVKSTGPEYKDTNTNRSSNNYSFSKEKEIAEADGASCEAEKQVDCQHNSPCSKDNNTWDSEVDDFEETNTEKQYLYSRETFKGLRKPEIKDYLVSEGIMSEYDNIEDIDKYIEPEEKVETTCNTDNICAIEVEEDVEVEEKLEQLPKIPKNGVVRLVYDLNEYWEKQGFTPSAKKYEKYTKNIVKLLTNGNFFYDTGLGEKDKKYSQEELFNAVDNRVNSYNLAVGDKKKEIKKLPLWLWLYNEKKKYSQFLIDLNGYEKKVEDKYPLLTDAIKKEYVKGILNGISTQKWTLKQEQDFIEASKKCIIFFSENRKKIKNTWVLNESQMARFLIKGILYSTDGVVEKIHTGWLKSNKTYNDRIGKYLNDQAVSKSEINYSIDVNR